MSYEPKAVKKQKWCQTKSCRTKKIIIKITEFPQRAEGLSNFSRQKQRAYKK
jgi:hypothetical protein